MACTSYSNNGSVNVVFSMSSLPEGFCPANYQAMFDAVAQYLVGTLPGNYSTFLISDTTPAAADRDKLWVQVGTDCKPVGFFLYNTTHGAWLPVGQKVFDGGTAGGTANALTATADPVLKYLADGCLFIVKAGANANTGAVTLNVSGTGTYPVTKQGNQTLEGGEIAPDMVLLLNVRDILTVPYYELLNPAPPVASVVVPENRVVNGSFEVSSLGNNLPAGWTFAAIGAGTGAVNTSVVGHGARSFAFTVSASGGGSLVQDDLMPCNDGEVMVLSFWNRTTDTGATDLVTVDWFEEDGTTPVGGTDTIWSGGASRTVNTWERMFAGMVAPAGARFFQVSVVGGSTGAATGTSYFDGLMVETVVFKRRCEFHYAGSAVSVSYNFVPPTGVTLVKVTAVGGGGKGQAGVNDYNFYLGGGGAGGTVVAINPVTPGTSYTAVVGCGATAALAATASSFNSVVADPGANGTNSMNPTGNGGAGGSGTVPAGSTGWVFDGGAGTDGVGSPGNPSGHGGNGYGGGGFGVEATSVGNRGSNYGGGGSAGGGSTTPAGGAGGDGLIFIEY